MKKNYILSIIGISALGLVVLIIFQVNWIWEGKKLREAQFDHRVSMALCYLVGQLEENPLSCMPNGASCVPAEQSCGTSCGTFLTQLPDEDTLAVLVKHALERHQLPTDYEYRLQQKAPLPTLGNWAGLADPSYTCAVGNTSDIKLEIFFPEKTRIILGQMGFMLGSSVVVILFISFCFMLTILAAWRQRRLAQQNVSFFNHLAHEFRTPLSNIKLASNMLARKLSKQENPPSGRFLSVIKEENERMIAQVDQVLDFARMERGEQAMTFEKLDLVVHIQEAVDIIQLRLKATGGSIQWHQDVSDTTIQGDAFHLKQVWLNLLDNAIKYANAIPKITISIIQKDNYLLVSFADQGIGIAADQLKAIFKQYVRLEDKHAQSSRGFGLGLAYTKMVVDAHQGYMEVRSKLGEGSCFSVYLPLTDHIS